MSFAALVLLQFFLFSAWGLYQLKPWARHSVAGEYAMFVFIALRSFVFFGATGGFSRVSQDALQPYYVKIAVAGMISLTLWLYGDVAEAFGEEV